MSFSQDVRATRNFQRQFGKEKRRLQLSEIPKADIDSMQEHVIEGRTQCHFLDSACTTENIHDIEDGPHDYIFEPDYNTVKIRTLFRDVYGIGTYELQTINGVFYDSLELYDQAASTSRLWYAIPQQLVGSEDFSLFHKWRVGFHPPNLEHGNSIHLNLGTISNQFLYVSDVGTNFDFTANDISLGFWIYPTAVSGNKRVIAYRRVDASNQWSIEMDTDGIIFVIFKDATVETKRQYSTPLTANAWYFISVTWDESAAGLVLKVNDNADASSTKTTGTTSTSNNLFFGSYAGATSTQDFRGYLTGLTYYKDLLSTTETTRLYNFDTKSDTIVPLTWGYGLYG